MPWGMISTEPSLVGFNHIHFVNKNSLQSSNQSRTQVSCIHMKWHIQPFLVLLCLLASSLFGLAQDNTRNFGHTFYSSKTASVAVVPFTPRMLISDIHRDMCVKNGMTSKEVQAALAEGFCHAMRISKPDRAESIVYGWEDEWPDALVSLYGEMGYEMKAVRPEAEDSTRMQARITAGELRIRQDTVTRYMSAVIDSTTMSAFAIASKSNFVLVVTELDIVNLGDPIQVNPKGAALFVRLHYTLFDPTGKEISGGMIKSPLGNKTYEPTKFAREEFIDAAERLYAQISDILVPKIQTED